MTKGTANVPHRQTVWGGGHTGRHKGGYAQCRVLSLYTFKIYKWFISLPMCKCISTDFLPYKGHEVSLSSPSVSIYNCVECCALFYYIYLCKSHTHKSVCQGMCVKSRGQPTELSYTMWDLGIELGSSGPHHKVSHQTIILFLFKNSKDWVG